MWVNYFFTLVHGHEFCLPYTTRKQFYQTRQNGILTKNSSFSGWPLSTSLLPWKKTYYICPTTWKWERIFHIHCLSHLQVIVALFLVVWGKLDEIFHLGEIENYRESSSFCQMVISSSITVATWVILIPQYDTEIFGSSWRSFILVVLVAKFLV